MNEVKKKGLLTRMAVPLMLLMFIAPMVAAWIVFNYFPDVVRSLGSSNYGEFIIPPVEVSLEGYTDIDNQPVADTLFRKHWSYVYITDKCDVECIEHLTLIKNVRLTQGKEISRVQRLLVMGTAPDETLRQRLQTDFAGMQTLLLTDRGSREAFMKPFSFNANPDPLSSGLIYIVDPDQKLMMYYENDKQILQLGKGMQKDMSKLLYNSQLRK